MTGSAATPPPPAPSEGPRRSIPLVWLLCAAQWLVPGAGYLLLGRFHRALIGFLSVTILFAWGIHLQAQLDWPVAGQIVSFLRFFAQVGVGVGYLVVIKGPLHGRGDPTAATSEIGNTLVYAAGLGAYLLLLDVYDIAVGRKS